MSVRSMSTFVDGAKSWIIYSRILRIYRFPGGGWGGGNFAHDGGATEDVATQISLAEQ